jgi:hypothetical protein
MVGWTAGWAARDWSGAGSAGRNSTAERQHGRRPSTPSRYRNTRYWALWEDGQLLAVTVYKKGAVTLMRRLQQMRRRA